MRKQCAFVRQKGESSGVCQGVKYFEMHIGDYMRDTAHLSMVEDGAYKRLLFWYYANEKPIPADIKQACRFVSANSKQEREAVAAVLKDFFVLEEDGYHQARADKEISRFKDKQEKARKSAEIGVAVRRELAAGSNREKREARMEEAAAKGTHTAAEWEALKIVCGSLCVKCGSGDSLTRDHILPVYLGGSDSIENIQPLCKSCNSSKDPDDRDFRPQDWRERLRERLEPSLTNAERTLSERSTNGMLTNNQEPITNNQTTTKPLAQRSRALLSPEFEEFWSAYPRKRSRGEAEKAWRSLSPNEQLVPAILQAIAVAKTSEQWRREGGAYIPYPATWLRAKGWLDEIAPAKPESRRDSLSWLTSDRATEAKGRELGMTPRPGEDWEQYRTRIRAQLRRQETESV